MLMAWHRGLGAAVVEQSAGRLLLALYLMAVGITTAVRPRLCWLVLEGVRHSLALQAAAAAAMHLGWL